MKKVIMLSVALLPLLHVSAKNSKEEKASAPMSDNHFREYAMNVEAVLASNKRIIESLQKNYDITNKKVVRKIHQLKLENIELMTELNEYTEYGIGDWRLFREEFGRDLAELNADLELLNNLVTHEFLLAEEKK